MWALGGMNEAISGKRIVVIPGLFMNVLQKQVRDSYREYISSVPDEIKEMRDKNN